MNPIIEIEKLHVGYENKPDVLKEVSLTVFENDFLGIIGPNGGGKTTLLKAIMGLQAPSSGRISFFEDGRRVNHINIGYLPQINQIDKKFPISVHEVILSGLTLRGKFIKRYRAEDKQRVEPIAVKMGVEDLLHRAIGELSGGQLQRVLLGRAIIDNPRLIILDEPSSYVDKRFENNFYKLLDEINREIAIVLVSHDVGTIISQVKNIACVNQTLHYHSGSNISHEWLMGAYDSCPIEIIGHGALPHRVLLQHDHDHQEE
jgi:zinc transport system ATP-binding protein